MGLALLKLGGLLSSDLQHGGQRWKVLFLTALHFVHLFISLSAESLKGFGGRE